MSAKWVNRVLGHHAKVDKQRQLRKQRSRRLLLQNLESRQLLAGDMLLHETSIGDVDPVADVAHANHSMATTASIANLAGHMAHPAAMALVSLDQATNTVVSSGNWSDPAVWQNGAIPQAGARIVIPQGMTLTVDSVMETEFKTIGIHGTLNFATDVNTELQVDTIVSAPHGRFEMGTAANPISADVTAKVVFADDGAIDTNWDPEQLSRGAILQGTTVVHGAETTHRVTLESFPAADATSIQLSSVPLNWNAGDEIVITGTQGSTSDEVRTIQSIDGTSVALNEPLQLDHIPPKADLNVYVANKTRNVQFSSENTDVERRGHIMLMHTLDANIHNAEFSDLGRTDKSRELDDLIFEFPEDAVGNLNSAPTVYTVTTGERTNVRGRYAVHFHRGGVDPGSTPATIAGSVVDGSPGWGLVNHSANVDMINNVAYGVQGAAFYTEVGDEIGSMVGNIAIRTVSPTFMLDDEGAIDPDLRLDRMDFGVDGDGYWLSGHMVSMRDNVSAGASGHGIIIWSDGVIEPDLARGRSSVLVANVENGNLITGRETIPTWWAPLAEIRDNESYGATIGFRSRYVHSQGYLGEIGSGFHTPPDQAYIDTLNPTIDGLTVWGSRDGVLMNYNERMSIKNARLVGIGAPYVQNGGTADTGVGIDMYNEITRGPGVIENVSIEGFNMGLLAPRQDDWQLSDVQLSNTTDMLITEMVEAPRTLAMTNVTFGSLDGTAVADQSSSRRNIVMQTFFDANPAHPFNFMMSDRVTLDGQQLYFNQQAADFVPTAGEIAASPGQVPGSMIGLTNQQLVDRFGTSFGGAIIPADATTAEFLTGGVVGSVAAPAATSPPIYHPASEGAVIIDPGTLTNFDGPVVNPENGDDEDDETDDGSGDEEDTGEGNDQDEDGDMTDEGDDESDCDEESDNGDGEVGDGDESDDGSEEEIDEGDDEADEGGDESGGGEAADEGDDEPDDGSEEEIDEGDDQADEGDDESGGGEAADEGDDEPDDGSEEEIDEGDETDEGEDGEETGDHHESEESDAADLDETDIHNDESEDEFECDVPVESDDDSDEDDPEKDDESDPEADGVGTEDSDADDEADDDFHNDDLPTDVNNDGSTTPLDALVILNFLNQHGSEILQTVSSALQHYIDVNNDGKASAIDALQIINSIAKGAQANTQSQAVDVAILADEGFGDDEDEEDDQLLGLLSREIR